MMTAHSPSMPGTETAIPVDDEILTLLSDDYACEVLRVLGTGPKTACEILTHCEMSRPTVYRRLDRLADAGMVTTESSDDTPHATGTVYQLAVNQIDLRVDTDGIDGLARTARPLDPSSSR